MVFLLVALYWRPILAIIISVSRQLYSCGISIVEDLANGKAIASPAPPHPFFHNEMVEL